MDDRIIMEQEKKRQNILEDFKPVKNVVPDGLVYPEEPFEDFYHTFKGQPIRDVVNSDTFKEIYSNFYEFHPYELDIPVGEKTDDLNMFDGETQLNEIIKSARSFEYWCHRYVKILHPKFGTIPFILYKYQRKVINQYNNHKYTMISKFRQGGLTTVAVLWGLWKAIFQVDQQIYVLSKTDREALAAGDIAEKAMHNFPYWMYDEEKALLTRHEKKFTDTGSKLCFYTPEAARGKSATYIIIDEAAFIDNMEEHWKAMYPVIATGGNIEVISTVNGLGNWYETMYHEAEAGLNFFHIIDLDYWEHPIYANPEWAKNTKANMGDKAWQQEVLRDFLGSGETYIPPHIIGQLTRFTSHNPPARTAFNKWHNKMDVQKLNWEEGALWIWKEPVDGHEYIIGVDCAEGVGDDGDNSCFQVIDGATMEQVAEFYSKFVPPHIFAQIINQIGIYYNTATCVVEANAVGAAVLSNLSNDLAYEGLYYEPKGKSAVNNPGIKVGQVNRSVYLEALQHRLISGQVRINSKRFVHELKTFIYSAQKRKPEAMKGKHDDAIMAMSMALKIREERMRGIPVGADVPEEMTQIFKTETYEEIKREILEGGVEDWLGEDRIEDTFDPLLAPSYDALAPSIKVKRRNDKLLKEFGWMINWLLLGGSLLSTLT